MLVSILRIYLHKKVEIFSSPLYVYLYIFYQLLPILQLLFSSYQLSFQALQRIKHVKV